MMTRSIQIILFLFFQLAAFVTRAQQPETIRNYINTYKELAIAEMRRTGVPASITLAQGIHETMAGTSSLVLKSNNHFGIKCKTGWTGESVSHDDDARGECFRKYPDAEESYRDHSDFLKKSPRYASLFSLEPTDYTGWAMGLKKAGYATNPRYPQVLIKLVEEYGLQEYTLIALDKNPVEGTDNGVPPADTTVQKGIGGFKSMGEIYQAKGVSNRDNSSYPAGAFRINDTRVVWMRKGTSFLAVAKQYDIPLSRLFEFNELAEAEAADQDQLIFLQRKRRTGADDYYKVLPGETLHDIAQKQGIRLESLMELNRLSGNERPAPGENLSLRKKSSVMPKLMVKENFSLYSAGRKPAQQ
ncbi:MAG: glucosaminidase domain-containing protein [Sphingobacteriales bacterium]|nr:glucosaminidase domain-containing protein [Sphingobacteriales bacterium]